MLRRFERIALKLLPAAERECVVGDLNEEFDEPSGVRRSWALLRIATRYQMDPYREINNAIATLALTVMGLLVLWTVQVASISTFSDPVVLANPVIKAAMYVWNASRITSAIAAGLLIGRVYFSPEIGVPVRRHVALVMTLVIAFSRSGYQETGWAVVVFLGMYIIGERARKATASFGI